MGFTAVLSTTNARPGNVVLAYAQQAPLSTAASIVALAAMSAFARVRHGAETALPASSTVTALIHAHRGAQTVIDGSASLEASAGDTDRLVCSMQASSALSVNPNLVLLIPFFEPTAIPGDLRPVVGLRASVPGTPLQTSGVVLSSLPRKTQTGGVPNEG